MFPLHATVHGMEGPQDDLLQGEGHHAEHDQGGAGDGQQVGQLTHHYGLGTYRFSVTKSL